MNIGLLVVINVEICSIQLRYNKIMIIKTTNRTLLNKKISKIYNSKIIIMNINNNKKM